MSALPVAVGVDPPATAEIDGPTSGTRKRECGEVIASSKGANEKEGRASTASSPIGPSAFRTLEILSVSIFEI